MRRFLGEGRACCEVTQEAGVYSVWGERGAGHITTWMLGIWDRGCNVSWDSRGRLYRSRAVTAA